MFVASGDPHSLTCTSASALKQPAGREGGTLLERKHRKGGRQKQRDRAGVGNPPLHLLVIYSFMLSRRLAT